MKGHKVTCVAITRYDQRHHTSLLRELEMVVASLVDFESRYAIQFFSDVSTYGIVRAKRCIVRFVEARGKADEKASDIVELAQLVERIRDKVIPMLVRDAAYQGV